MPVVALQAESTAVLQCMSGESGCWGQQTLDSKVDMAEGSTRAGTSVRLYCNRHMDSKVITSQHLKRLNLHSSRDDQRRCRMRSNTDSLIENRPVNFCEMQRIWTTHFRWADN